MDIESSLRVHLHFPKSVWAIVSVIWLGRDTVTKAILRKGFTRGLADSFRLSVSISITHGTGAWQLRGRRGTGVVAESSPSRS